MFVGVELEPPLRTAIAGALGGLERAGARELRLVSPDSYHLTLQFLGDVPGEAQAALPLACDRAAGECEAFAFELASVGAFPTPRRARIVWIGVGAGAEQLSCLHARLHERTAPLGFAGEARTYHPHLTVARLRRPADLRAALSSVALPELVVRAEALTLFRSHLSPGGSRYECLHRAPLRRGG